MELKPRCIPCEVEGAYEQVEMSTDDEDVKLEALRSALNRIHSKSSEEIPPAELGTERNKVIRNVTSNPDPYSEVKEKMNDNARKLESIAKEYIREGTGEEDRLRRAVKVAAVGNSFDFSVSEHSLDFETVEEEFKENLNSGLAVDDVDLVTSKILSSDEILYLLDNPGEAIMDKLLIEMIKETNNGVTVKIGARSAPVQDDITVEMAKSLDFQEVGEILPSGRSTGFNPSKCPKKISAFSEEADLILSKGQGNYEILSEYEDLFFDKLVYLLRAKCTPVSNSLGVSKGSTVVYSVGGK